MKWAFRILRKGAARGLRPKASPCRSRWNCRKTSHGGSKPSGRTCLARRSQGLALETYRSQALPAAQLRRLLGFETRMQVDAFLKEHDVYDFTATDFEQDRETLRQFRATEAQF